MGDPHSCATWSGAVKFLQAGAVEHQQQMLEQMTGENSILATVHKGLTSSRALSRQEHTSRATGA